MGIRRLGTVALLLSLISFTLPVQIVLAQGGGYLDITSVLAPASVIVGQVVNMTVSVKWSSLHTYAWGNPVYVRAEICEGTDLGNCNPLLFAPSVDGEPIRDESGMTGSRDYSFSIHAPEQAMVWHLIALFEVAAMKAGATENAVWRGDAGWLGYHWAVPTIPNDGHHPWSAFDIVVKPSQNAFPTSSTLFADGFESGLGAWNVSGIVTAVKKNSVVNYPNAPPEGHSGLYAALLGIDWSGGTPLNVIPKQAGLAYSFSLRREIAVTPGSDLTVTFWYRLVYPYVSPAGPLPNMFLTYSVNSTVGTLDEVTFHEADWLPPAWRSVTRSVSVPVQVSTVVLAFSGRGWIDESSAEIAGALELDDVLVTERAFSVTTTTLSSTTTLASTTTSQTEIESSSTVASAFSVQTENSTASLQMPFLAILVGALVVLAIVGVLLVRKRKAPGTPTAETKTEETTPEKSEVYCFYCGAPMPTDAKFCRQCGKAQKPE